MTPRAALYARYSSDRQSETSVADQHRITAAAARDRGLEVVARYADEAVSGSIPVGRRRGSAAMLADALAGDFTVLVMEGLDRLSRDMVDCEQIVRRLEHAGIRIIGVADGYDSASGARKIQRSVRALLNDVYLDDLRHKTHRGLAGKVERGLSAGGRSYGYRTEATEGGRQLVIDEAEATWVRWIHARYAEGWSPQRIAHQLNEQGVRSPRGGTWAVSAIYGTPAHGTGILSNRLYIGELVWNRGAWRKDPDTKRRQRVQRPESEWMVRPMPHLRILSDAEWAATEARRAAPMHAGGRRRGAPVRSLYSGLLRCMACGGAVVAVSKTEYGCAARKDRGPAVCAGVRARRELLDLQLQGLVREEIVNPTMLVELQAEVARLRDYVRQHEQQARRQRAARAAEIDREIANLVDVLARLGGSPAIEARLRELEAQREQPATASGDERDLVSVSEALATYRRKVMNLQSAFDDDPDVARTLIADLLGPVELERREAEVWAHVRGREYALAQILNGVAGTRIVNWNQPPGRIWRVQ